MIVVSGKSFNVSKIRFSPDIIITSVIVCFYVFFVCLYVFIL